MNYLFSTYKELHVGDLDAQQRKAFDFWAKEINDVISQSDCKRLKNKPPKLIVREFSEGLSKWKVTSAFNTIFVFSDLLVEAVTFRH